MTDDQLSKRERDTVLSALLHSSVQRSTIGKVMEKLAPPVTSAGAQRDRGSAESPAGTAGPLERDD